MPLQSSDAKPVFDMWGAYFQMVTRAGSPVRCRVTRGALEHLQGETGRVSSTLTDQAFAVLRTRVEDIASRKFDADHVKRNAVLLIELQDVSLC